MTTKIDTDYLCYKCLNLRATYGKKVEGCILAAQASMYRDTKEAELVQALNVPAICDSCAKKIRNWIEFL